MSIVAIDNYAGKPGRAIGVDTPATHAEVVTKSDTDELVNVSRALYVGVTGDVVVVMRDDAIATAVTFKAVPAGTVLPIRARQVMSTGTTATNILSLS